MCPYRLRQKLPLGRWASISGIHAALSFGKMVIDGGKSFLPSAAVSVIIISIMKVWTSPVISALTVSFFTDFQSLKQEIPSRYDFITLENCELICIPIDKLTQAYQHYPSLERFGRLMAEKTANRISRMAHSLLMESPETRYQNLLDNRPELMQRIPQRYIANYLGIKPESLSRLKKRIYDRSKS